ncbi:ferric reductase-like transmembrane domain-containing protein [Nocardioides sp. CBS4Y-1]|uniref:Ferric reductase-like transmembrane domain-containing protein n=2 Tax=Nocardioides acrostichi TaxID=2784339 RepID=A0A930Y6V7_9ACTN|nr:ferric reductase-like transmembrane domain-containing protein [Nocardioides acrostichi]
MLLYGALALVAWWWIGDGGIGDLADGHQALVSLGRISGLAASVLLLTQVLLMARIPVLEGAWGQDRLARIHRVVGFTSFNLMVAHIVLISWGYAAGDLLATPGLVWYLIRDYPGILLATAGALALVMVVLTSIRAARRRLRYESWHLLHLYAYLGVGLALPHQLWTGQQFTGSAARTAFWWTAWGATAVAVVAFRLGVPAYRTWRHDLRVTSVVREPSAADDEVWSVYLSGRDLHRMPVRAGQFLTFRFLNGAGWSRAHPYSLSAAPDDRSLRATVRVVGDGTRALRHVTPGTRVVVEGPYGRLSSRPRTQRKVAFIGAGIGITPLRSLAEGLDYAPGEAVLLHRCTSAPLFAAELDLLAAERGLRVVTLPGRRRAHDSFMPRAHGADEAFNRVNDVTALLWLVPDLTERDVYLCGPDTWEKQVVSAALAAGLPSSQLHSESFRW